MFWNILRPKPLFHGVVSATSRHKGNRIIGISGAGDGNRTHVRSLGMLEFLCVLSRCSFYSGLGNRRITIVFKADGDETRSELLIRTFSQEVRGQMEFWAQGIASGHPKVVRLLLALMAPKLVRRWLATLRSRQRRLYRYTY